MNCSNCGNLVAPGEVCVTCGTLAVDAEPGGSSGGAQPEGIEGPPSSRVALALGAVGLLAVGVVAGALLFRSGGTEVVTAVEEAATTVVVSSVPPSSTTSVAVAVGSPTGDWQAASIAGALPRFESPDSDRSLGEAAPAIDGFDFGGNPVAIADNGQPKVVVFLAHWCPHCQREVPVVQEYLDSVGLPDGVELISIATSIDATRPNYPPDAWLEREGWTSPVIVDPDGAIAEAYGLAAFPFYVFIREDFTIDFRITGELDPQPVFEYTSTLFGPAPERPVLGPSNYAEAAVQDPACGAAAPDAPASLSFDAPGQGPAGDALVFVTSCGEIVVDLDADAAPETVNSMRFLAAEGYFDGTVCHRLVLGFVLQCGDPTATGTGSPGYVLPDEFPADSSAYQLGTVAMANAGAGTTGSQFFVVIGDASFLPPTFTVIGQVADVAPLIAALETVPLGLSATGETSAPLETIYIESAVIGP